MTPRFRLPMALAFALASAALSFAAVTRFAKVLTIGTFTGGGSDDLSLLPGLFLGIALGLSMAIAEGARPLRVVIAALIVTVAWPLAYIASVFAYGPIDAAVPKSIAVGLREPVLLSLAMMAGNVIGGVMTLTAGTIAAGRRLGGPYWAWALLAGAAAVVISTFTTGKADDGLIFLALFATWQCGILGMLHLGLMERPAGAG